MVDGEFPMQIMPTDNTIDDVVIVGGGDVGLATALALRELNPGLSISVVDDFSADPPAVGKSTYQSILDLLHGFLGIPEDRFTREVKPIWKGSVYFEDWCGYDPFHYTFDFFVQYPDRAAPKAADQYYFQYDTVAVDPEYRTVSEAMVEEGKSPVYFERNGHDRYQAVAYHLDLERFNSLLADLCSERGVDTVDDRITDVDVSAGTVDALHSETTTYEADLYVDASGFNRVIKSELDAEFRTFDLPVDTAFTTKVDRPLSEAVPATVVESGDAGWFWGIDTFEFRDLGYVFSSKHTSDDEAAAEFIDHCDADLSRRDLTRYEFDSGYYPAAWEGNCVAVGNAEGFVEPLQSTALTSALQSAANLSIALSSNGRVDPNSARGLYNAWVERMWESIYDFIAVHYRYGDGDTSFWEAAQSVPVGRRVERLENHFDQCGYNTKLNPLNTPDPEEGPLPELAVIAPINFFIIMRNMGVESAFYEDNDITVDDDVRADLEEFYDSMEQRADQLLTVEEVYKGLLQRPEESGAERTTTPDQLTNRMQD